jgi:hypothetical protein
MKGLREVSLETEVKGGLIVLYYETKHPFLGM